MDDDQIEPATENAAAFRFAELNLPEDEIDLFDSVSLVRRRAGETWELHDTEKYHPRPNRPSGTILVHDAGAFTAAVGLRDGREKAVVYSDEGSAALVAVLNDDEGTDAGWRDYRVSLTLRRTPEWSAWLSGQGLGDQEKFAERIEDGEPEILDPAASIMLELAQSFHATVGVRFRGGTRLASGARQFAWDETVEASGGIEPGSITIPETFTIAVRPFVRSDPWEVKARFRYRLRAGELQIGYDLVRPEEIERQAFAGVVVAVQSDLDRPFIRVLSLRPRR